jgi:alkanesulfonate monooxygenase SsuD/methylene tetrahydromethanopterin reductase-like flavin-dependent oxidoreductase (luciferase family)
VAERRGVALTPMETRHEVIVGAAQLADELGYEAFALPEGWGLDSTLLLTDLAQRTRRITLVSGVLSVWGRTPATLAMTAATLYRLTQGRYVLGLGTSTRALAEGFHDVAFERPADRLREVTTKVRALLAGERARLDNGAAARPLRLGLPPVPELPIWLAALGERTSRVAAEVGDGWIPMFVRPERLAGRVMELGRVRRAAGRPGPLTVAAGPWTVADADAGAARGVVASCVAWYLSAMGDVYGRTVADQGYAAAVEAVRAANPHPRPGDAVVPAEARVVLDEFTAHGTAAQVREQLERWDGAADLTLVLLPPGMPWDTVETTLRAAAPRAGP